MPSNATPTRLAVNAAFELAVREVLKHEGEYVNDPVDPGGETKFGISKRAHPTVDIAALTEDAARAIYRRDYWDSIGCDRLPPRVALAVFDCAVNQGPAIAVRLLQQSLSVEMDGILGPVTAAAANAQEPKTLLVEFLARRAQRYATSDPPKFVRFGHGWLRRLFAIHQACLLGST